MIDWHGKMSRYRRAAVILGAVSVLAFSAWVPIHGGTVVDAQSAAARSTAGAQATGSAPQSWPEYLGNAARSGLQYTTTLLSAATAGSLVPVTGTAFSPIGAVASSPAIVNGIVYYAATVPVSTTAQGKTIVSRAMMRAALPTGQVLWSRPFTGCGPAPTTDLVLSSPAVGVGLVNGVATQQVFIGWTEYLNGNVQGCVFDFNGVTGALIWSFPVAGGDVMGSPALMASNSGALVVVGGNDDHLHAFSLNYTGPMSGTATEVWNYNTQTDIPPPAYAQYCNAQEGCGDAIWSSPSEGIVTVNGTPHHYVFFGLGANPDGHYVGRLDAVDMDTIVNGSPTLAWAFWDPNVRPDNDFSIVQTLTDQYGKALRVFTAMHVGHMYSIDPATGHLIFDFNVPVALGRPVSTLNGAGAFAGGNGAYQYIFGTGCSLGTWTISCGTGVASNGYILAIDAMTTTPSGRLLWTSQDLGGEIVSAPTAINLGANAVLFALGPYNSGSPYRGDLLALDPKTGVLLGAYPVNNHAWGTVGSVAVYGNTIFVPEGYGVIDTNAWSQGGELAAFTCAGCP